MSPVPKARVPLEPAIRRPLVFGQLILTQTGNRKHRLAEIAKYEASAGSGVLNRFGVEHRSLISGVQKVFRISIGFQSRDRKGALLSPLKQPPGMPVKRENSVSVLKRKKSRMETKNLSIANVDFEDAEEMARFREERDSLYAERKSAIIADFKRNGDLDEQSLAYFNADERARELNHGSGRAA